MTTPDRLFSFDLETTGLNITEDRIVSAAVVGEFLPNGGRKIYVNPGIAIPAEATRIHGITDDAVSDQLPYAEGLHLIHRMLSWAWGNGGTMVGHNIHGYDLPMLRMQERVVFGNPLTNFGPTLDTLPSYRRAFPGETATLTVACERLGVPLHGAHDAAADAWAALGVARALNATAVALA